MTTEFTTPLGSPGISGFTTPPRILPPQPTPMNIPNTGDVASLKDLATWKITQDNQLMGEPQYTSNPELNWKTSRHRKGYKLMPEELKKGIKDVKEGFERAHWQGEYLHRHQPLREKQLIDYYNDVPPENRYRIETFRSPSNYRPTPSPKEYAIPVLRSFNDRSRFLLDDYPANNELVANPDPYEPGDWEIPYIEEGLAEQGRDLQRGEQRRHERTRRRYNPY
jgi:hypothetical protein